VQRIAETTSHVVIDIGCGEGAYSDLARGWRPDAFWLGVEVWEPYVEQFDLWRKYDAVAVIDARQLALPAFPYVLLAGDVLEHMPRADSVAFLNRAVEHAEAIMVSVPVVDYPQHDHNDNPYEEHLDQWAHADMIDQLPGCQHWRGNILGRYWWINPGEPEYPGEPE
jgi:hypothetical protein